MNKKNYIELRKKINLARNSRTYYIYGVCELSLLSLIVFATSSIDSWSRFMAIPMIAILMFRNFSIMHDAVHGSLTKKSLLNDMIGMISGAVCMLPYEPWKLIHLEHHYWSGNVEKDPVMGLLRSFPNWPKPFQNASTVLWKVWMPALATFQHFVFWWHCTVKAAKNPMAIKNLFSVILPFTLWGTLLFTLPIQLSLYVVVPAIFLYLIVVEVVNLPHHVGLAQGRGDLKLPVWQQYRIARSCTYPKLISQFIVLNFNYHTEHHMFPDATWYQLADIHQVLKSELQSEMNTDLQFAWIIQNRSKNLNEVLSVPVIVEGDNITTVKAA